LQSVNDLSVSHALIEAVDLVSVHGNEGFLGDYVFVGFLFCEELLHQLEESLRIEFKEPIHEFVISGESYYVIYVDPPLESTQCALGELLPL